MAVYEVKKTTSEERSYLDIVRSNGNIVIPLIQRDYAQGRATPKATDIRENFIADLHKYIINGTRLNLDFVYGASKDSKFVPLDGQQRLTTLFLIHLYLDGLRGEGKEDIKFQFSYETRDSSRRFCEKLIESRYIIFNAEELTPRKDADGKMVVPRLSEIIQNQSWWLYSWKADPTVDGMVRMLDQIHTVFFSDWKKAADNLFNPGIKTILFQFLPLHNFYDPDDLYIKMNARGLPLTDFEIFKGKLMEQIERICSPDEVKEMKSLIDVRWTDFLWPLRKEGYRNIDPYFRNLLKMVISSGVASLGNEIDKVDFDTLFEANGKTVTFSYGKYTEEYNVDFTVSLLGRIKSDLNQICNDNSIFTRFRNGTIKNDGWVDLEKIWQDFVIQEENPDSPDYKSRVVFYAFTRFSDILASANENEVVQWARLIHNLVENKLFNSSKDAVNAMKDIDSMLDELKVFGINKASGSRVNEWVAQSKFVPVGFTESQWQEEVVKAELRKDSKWNDEITKAERHSYLDGKIALILWCADEIPNILPFKVEGLKRDLEKFKLYSDRCLHLFDMAGNNDSECTQQHLLVKALLTKGDYMPMLSANRKNIYNNPGHRDYSWRALFRINESTNIKALDCLKQILDDADFDYDNVNTSLKSIIRKRERRSMPIWRRLLTSRFGHSILSCSRQGFISFDGRDERNMLIYGSSRRSGYHTALNILYLEALLKEYKPNSKFSIDWRMGAEDDYTIEINEHSISYWNDAWKTDDNQSFSRIYDLANYIRQILRI